MAKPAVFKPTPGASLTLAIGYSGDASAEVWQRITGGLHIVRAGVPADIAANVLEAKDVDTAVRTLLDGFYPKRVSS
jgi:hypothetical protein